MATVTGVTKDYADAIGSRIIVQAQRQGTSLILTTEGGATINVEKAFPAAYEMYPVGSIYMSTRGDNPSSYMGGGTWVRWGKGRVPVGVDEADTQFDAVEEVGGAKTHALSVSEMPSHNHGGNTGGQSQDHTHSGYAYPNGAHSHGYETANDTYPGMGSGGVTAFRGYRSAATTSDSGNHDHSVQTNGSSNDHHHGINEQGGGLGHNNLQPYITVFMWKRTA